MKPAGLALLVLAWPAPARFALPHPLDGPDLDLRVQVAQTKVTVDAMFNLAFVDELMPMAREDEYALAEPEQPAVRERMFAWLKLNTVLRLDGVAVTPTLAQFAVDPGDLRWLPMFPAFGTKALIKVRFVLEFKALQPPRSVNLVWQAYPPNLLLGTAERPAFNDVPALLTAGGTEQVVVLRHDEPEFTWHAPAEGTAVRLLPVPQPPRPARILVPLLSVAVLVLLLGATAWLGAARRWRALAGAWLAGAAVAVATRPVLRVDVESPFGARVALPTAAEAAAIFAPLHANVYRAFDYTEPAEVYDALARSVDGSLLDTIYQDVYRSLVMAEEGGAVSRIQEVRPLHTEVEHLGVLADGRTPSFTVLARWQVDGAVFHWGHQHWRTNEHRARYTVVGGAGGWRIAGAEPLAQERIEAGVGPRPRAGGEAK